METKPYKIIFGNINFYEKDVDGEDKAVVVETKGILNFNLPDEKVEEIEDLAEELIGKGYFNSYLIEPLYRFPIEFVEC